MAQSKLTIFSLPRELRDEIWILIVSHDLRLLSGQHKPLDIYKTPRDSRQHLSVFNLILVSRAVNREVTTTIRKRCAFTFHTSVLLRSLLEYGCSTWGRSERRLSECPTRTYSVCPRILFEMGHVSIFPNGPVNASQRLDNSFKWLFDGSRKRKEFAHAAHPPGWKTLDPGAAQLLDLIHKLPMKLRSLEMSAILLFNIRVVRQLRRLRGVDLHFAFIPDEIELPDKVFPAEDREHPVKWLAETADTNIVLPIYKTQSDIEPASVAPVSCLVTAIRREAAGSDTVRRVIYVNNQVNLDPPLWIDFDDESIAITQGIITSNTKTSLSIPTSGWYRYSARNPGVACLEMAEKPPPCEPPKRKMVKHRRLEWVRHTWEDKQLRDLLLRRCEIVDVPRALRIYRLGLEDIVVAHKPSR
ncbi:hypothetical protein V8C35DRAFT_317723 [Trichoderma chlorosporum]